MAKQIIINTCNNCPHLNRQSNHIRGRKWIYRYFCDHNDSLKNKKYTKDTIIDVVALTNWQDSLINITVQLPDWCPLKDKP